MHEFYCGGNIDARDEYNQTNEEKFEEFESLTDLLDELIAASRNIDSDLGSSLTVDSQKMHISRRFSFVEGDRHPGWAWPLVEKSLEINYEHSKASPTSETYTIILGTIIHQSGVSKNPILDRYEIAYYGPRRQSLITSIEEPNLIDDQAPDYIRRETTPYDQNQLFEQLQQFAGLIATQALDDSRAS